MGLTISVDWEQEEGCGYVLRVGNRNFTATTHLDVGTEDIAKLAGCIAGFPSRPGDERSFVFGERGPASPAGYCSLHFRSIGSSAEAVLDVALEASQPDVSTAKAKAQFSMFVELDDINRFVAALHVMAKGLADKAGW